MIVTANTFARETVLKRIQLHVSGLIIFSLLLSSALGQEPLGPPVNLKTFQLLIDVDRDQGTGLDLILNDGVTQAMGIELLTTVTVLAGNSPQVTRVEAQEWDGNAGFSAPYFVDSSGWAVGIDNGFSGGDVTEAYMPLDKFGENYVVNFYVQSGQLGSAHDVIDPVWFSFDIPIPTLSFWMLAAFILLMVILALWMSRGRLRMRHGIMLIFAGLFLVAAAGAIVLDGQVNDWTDPPIATDHIDDAGEDAVDLLAFFVCHDEQNLFFRFDVEELENQSPVAGDLTISLLEDTATLVSLTASDADGDTLTFSIISNPSFGTLGSLTSTGPNSADITYTPNADVAGMDSFTFSVDDLNGGTAVGLVDITITAVNDAPSFTPGPDLSVPKGSGPFTSAAWASAVSPGASNEANQTLQFQVSVSSNPQVFLVPPTIDPVSGDLTFTPDSDMNGTATIDVFLMDDGGTANGGLDTSTIHSFNIAVGSVNDAPSFVAGSDVINNEDDGMIMVNSWATAISPGPPDESGQILNFTVNNIQDPDGIFATPPALDVNSGDLTYTLAADQFGAATADITLMDDGGTANGGIDVSPVHTLMVTVNSINDAPTFSHAGNVDVPKSGGIELLPAWASSLAVGPANEAGQTLLGFTVLVVSDANNVLTVMPTVDLITGDLSFATDVNNNGTATIELTLQDDGGTANGGLDTSIPVMIDINVLAVNDPPSFTKGPDIIIDENAGPQTFNPWATGISAGPPDEAGQTLTFNVTANSNSAIFMSPPAIAADGTLTFESAPGAHTGMPATPVELTIELMDSGGTANGGSDTSGPQMFTIRINPVNSPPTATDDSYDAAVNTRLEVGTSTAALGHKIAGSVLTDGVMDSDPDGPGPLIVVGTSNVTAGASVAMNADGSFTYSPPPGMTGSDTFDYTITDQDPILPLTDTATVTINLYDSIWYVKNDHAGPSQGTSDNPFQSLAEAESASAPNDKIFLFIGDGNITGQNSGITLKNGQSLLGERVDLDLDINGNMSTIVIGTANSTLAPRIGNAAGDVVILADDNTVAGLIMLPTASAGISGSGAMTKKTSVNSDAAATIKPGDKRAGGTTLIEQIVINPSTSSDGLVLLAQTGALSLADIEIVGLAGNSGTGLILENCSASFSLDNLTISDVGIGVSLVTNSVAIDFSNTSVMNCSSTAIEVDNQDDATFAATCSVNQTGLGSAASVIGGNGTLAFLGPITVNSLGAGFSAIEIDGNSQDPTINFADISIDASAGNHAIHVMGMGMNSAINFNGVLDVNGAGIHGLFLENSNGSLDIVDATSDIANAMDTGVRIDSGSPSLAINGSLTNNETSVHVTNLAGGTTQFAQLIATGSFSSGFIADNCAGTHTVNLANLGSNANRLTNSGIQINACTGQFVMNDINIFSNGIGLDISGGNPDVDIMDSGTISSLNSLDTVVSADAGSLDGSFTNLIANTTAGVAPGISLTGAAGTITFQDVDIQSLSGTGILIDGGYTATFSTANTINVATTSGTGIDIQNTTNSGAIDQVVVSAGLSGGINLNNNSGSLSFGLIDLTMINGYGIRALNSGTLDVTNSTSSIACVSGGSALELNGITIGASNMNFASVSATLPGATNEGIDCDSVAGTSLIIGDTTITTTSVNGGNGIDIDSSSATFVFNSATINTDTHVGINLTNNMSASFSFNNCDIDTTSGTGFNASGGGMISGSGSNQIDTTTGRAIQIDGSNIGAGNFSLQSVNSNGAVNGIRLNNTGSAGGLIVTGTGTNDSGGNIQNSTSDGIFINNTVSFSLTDMQINNSTVSHIQMSNSNAVTLNGIDFFSSGFHGIVGSSVTALNMTNCGVDLSGNSANEHGLRIINLLGSSNITSNDFTRSQTIQFFVQNTAASINAPAAPTDILTFDDNSFSMPGATFGDNISIESATTGNMRVVLDDSVGQNTFVGGIAGIQAVTATGGTLDVVIDNIDVQTTSGSGINLGGFNASDLTFDVRNSETLNTGSIGINATSIGGAMVSGIIDNNTINGSTTGQGIQVITEGNGDITATVSNNTISNINQEHGIRVQARAGSGTINITINDNDVNNLAAPFPLEGIYVESGSSAGGDTNTICLNMFNNTSAANFNEGFRLRHRAGATFNLQDFVGVGSNPADVTTWINTTKSNIGTTQITGTGFTAAGGSCPTP